MIFFISMYFFKDCTAPFFAAPRPLRFHHCCRGEISVDAPSAGKLFLWSFFLSLPFYFLLILILSFMSCSHPKTHRTERIIYTTPLSPSIRYLYGSFFAYSYLNFAFVTLYKPSVTRFASNSRLKVRCPPLLLHDRSRCC